MKLKSPAWGKNDRKHFSGDVSANVGEVWPEDSLGSFIVKLASEDRYKSYLEIGTWNGLGSTKCFTLGFQNRCCEFDFYSLEINSDKHSFARQFYENQKNVYLLNETILNKRPTWFSILKVFPHLIVTRRKRQWLHVDLANLKTAKCFLNRSDLPTVFDVVLLDGGEYTTYFEYEVLKNRSKILILDDVKVSKCRRIRNELVNRADWELISEDLALRNGCSAFLRLTS